MRANFQNTKKGDKVIFSKEEPFYHWFFDRIENAKNLDKTKVYTVNEISVASSSTSVTLDEMGDLKYELSWFDKI
jgi:hypothetical protein